MSTPDTTYAGFPDAYRVCHGARSPVRCMGRFVSGGHLHHAFDHAGAYLMVPP